MRGTGIAGYPFPRLPLTVHRVARQVFFHDRDFHDRENCLSGNSILVMLLLSGILTCVTWRETLICFENSCVFNFPRLGCFSRLLVFPAQKPSSPVSQIPRLRTKFPGQLNSPFRTKIPAYFNSPFRNNFPVQAFFPLTPLRLVSPLRQIFPAQATIPAYGGWAKTPREQGSEDLSRRTYFQKQEHFNSNPNINQK